MRPFAGIRPPLAATLLVLLATTAPSVAPPVAAQDPPSVPGRLTLEEALEIARQRNPALRRARNQVRSAAAGERQRWGQYLPSLSTSFSLSGNTSRRVTGEDDFGLPVSLDDPLEFEGSSTSQSMTLSYTLFDGFARENGLDQARAASRVATAGVEAERVRVEAEIRSAFYDALGAQRFIELERRLLASAEQRLETQRERLRVAAVDPEDVLGAEVDLANQQLAVERAVADARSFSLTLRETMGVDEDIEFEAVGGLPPLFDPSTLDADSLVGVALRTNPGVVQAAASVEEARHGVDIARGARWPTLSIGASVSRGMSLSSYELLRFREETVNPQNRTLGLSLSASWSPFTQFQTSTQIEQAEVQAANAAESLREQRLGVEGSVRAALIDLRNRHQAVEIAERAAEMSRQRLEMAEERFSTGSLDFIQLQQIIDQASQAERQAVQARIDFAKAVATLEQQLGTEVRR